ncbi:hypothetical protein COHA_008725 [Chlorella ohadii]|uniref:S1 motif domain-containing protein n=1 Tax=Chlorella ohadii TaxID=2649997 RepID=A0AAD5DG85_9CHLO|nr:hypothetical protein COHA_008725 [Chlorella ohadii]
MAELVTPGERLGLASEYDAGAGTVVRDTFVCATLVGEKRVLPAAEGESEQRPRLEVVRSGVEPVVPKQGDVVTARVIRINPRLAAVDILCVGPKPVQQRYSGVIRVQDVRATEIDKVQIQASFRPGDVVRAEVLSLGDARSYHLTTAKNELGVVYAKSVAGVPMVPISWQEMQCPQTKAVENRKLPQQLDSKRSQAFARLDPAPAAMPAMDGSSAGGTVFVTVGTTKFDALIRAVDQQAFADVLVAKGYTRLVMQIGRAEYRPRRLLPPNRRTGRLHNGLAVEYFEFAPSLAEHLRSAALVVSHAGSGSIFEALRLRRPLVVVPNPLLMDNHQVELADKLERMGHLYAATTDTLAQVVAGLDSRTLTPYDKGDPAGIVLRIDEAVGVRPKPLLMFFEQAREQAEREFKANNQDAMALTKWGGALLELAHFRQGNEAYDMIEEAIAKFEQALAIDARRHDALWCLGNAYTSQGFLSAEAASANEYFDKAGECFRKAVELEPGNDSYRRALEMSGKAPQLYQELQRQLQKPLISDFWYDVAGWVCLVGVVFGVAALSRTSAASGPAAA